MSWVFLFWSCLVQVLCDSCICLGISFLNLGKFSSMKKMTYLGEVAPKQKGFGGHSTRTRLAFCVYMSVVAHGGQRSESLEKKF